MRSPTGRGVAGARAGVQATVAMSALMLAARATDFDAEQPPERVVEWVLGQLGRDVAEPVQHALAVVAHFGYGAALGGVFARATRPAGALRGLGYGLAVWAVNYGAVLPLAGVVPWPHRDEPERQAVLLLAHAVFGVVLGYRTSALSGTCGARTSRNSSEPTAASAASRRSVEV